MNLKAMQLRNKGFAGNAFGTCLQSTRYEILKKFMKHVTSKSYKKKTKKERREVKRNRARQDLENEKKKKKVSIDIKEV